MVAHGVRVILTGVWLVYRVTLRTCRRRRVREASRRALRQELTDTSLLATNLGEGVVFDAPEIRFIHLDPERERGWIEQARARIRCTSVALRVGQAADNRSGPREWSSISEPTASGDWRASVVDR